MSLSRAMSVALIVLVACSPVAAQNQGQPDPERLVPDVVKKVFLDPTTYAPALVGWKATRLDWRSSQVFFQNGWSEHNPRFTVSGRGDDTAMGYAAGNRQILSDSLATLRLSLVNNVSARVMERLLMPRFPRHRTLLRTVGWIERSAIASYWSYLRAAGHFRQWQENERRAQELGFQ